MRFPFFLSAVLAAATFAGCYVPPTDPQPVDDPFDRMQEARDAYVAEFGRHKNRLQAGYTGPKRTDFPGHGSIVVSKYFLEGMPREEYLRVLLTYENTTREIFDSVRIWLIVKDKGGEPVASQWLDLVPPFGLRLAPGSSYTDEIRVLTNGEHRKPGWTWTIGCFAMRAVGNPQLPKRKRR